MYYIFCIRSSVEGHLGSFQLLDIINKDAMNIVEHVSILQVGASSGYMPAVVFLYLLVELCPIFWGILKLISRVVVPACSPTSNGGVFLFLHILCWASAVTWVFDFSHSDWCEVGISRLFWFAFPWWLRMLNISLGASQPFSNLVFFSWELLVYLCSTLLNRVIWFSGA